MKKITAKTANGLTQPKAMSLAVPDYDDVLSGVVELLETARRTSARTTNAIMTATYWEVGRRIVECEQGGAKRAEYGETLMERLSNDLTHRFGRGFSFRNIHLMRSFYQGWRILQKVSAEVNKSPIFQTLSGNFDLSQIAARFPLPWSHYVLLLKVDNADARRFDETEALRGGWSVRQMDRQISTLFYERTLASTRNEKPLSPSPRFGERGSGGEGRYVSISQDRGAFPSCSAPHPLPFSPDDRGEGGKIKFLSVARHRKCPKFPRRKRFHQARLVLCSQHNRAVAHYTIDRLSDKILAAEYRLALPDEQILVAEVERTQAALDERTPIAVTKKAKPIALKSKRKGGGK